jgi:hypothetical protein
METMVPAFRNSIERDHLPMSQGTMLSSVAMVCLLVSAASCAMPRPHEKQIMTYDMGNATFGITPLPVTAALVITKSDASAHQRFRIDCKDMDYSISMETEFLKAADPALRQSVSRLDVREGPVSPDTADMVIEMTVPSLDVTEERCRLDSGWAYNPLFWIVHGRTRTGDLHTAAVATSLDFRATVKGKHSRELFSQEYGWKGTTTLMSGGITTETDWEFGTSVSKAFHDLLRKLAFDMTDSGALRAYTRNTGSVHAHSDVDDLPPVHAAPLPRRYALVIGIEQYRRLPVAEYAGHDALMMAQYLTRVMGYQEQNVKVLINDHASLTDFRKYIEEWLPNNVEENGIVFVFYAGHGIQDVATKEAYLLPYDGDRGFITATGYSLSRLYHKLGELPAKEIVVALDSGFSGAGERSVLAEGSRPVGVTIPAGLPSNKIAVLTASSGIQPSSTYSEQGHSLFTYFLLKGLSREGDVNGDGVVDLGELYNYVALHVPGVAREHRNGEQTPQLVAPLGWDRSVRLIERAP